MTIIVGMTLLAATSYSPAFAKERTTPFPTPSLRFMDAAPSISDLLDRFLKALAANDRDALERLRVTEVEYRQIILPGSVDEGQPPQLMDDKFSEYFWGTLNGKSIYSGLALLKAFGGHTYRLKGYDYRKGIRHWAWYVAYQQLTLVVEDEQGGEQQLLTGSIAEVNGQYKFVSFIRD